MTPEQYKKLPRLYIEQKEVAVGKPASLMQEQVHYLTKVMRLEKGDSVRVFNGADGEWRACLAEVSKRSVILIFEEKMAEQRSVPDIHVLASVVKKEAFEYMVQKSSELGAAVLTPVLCDHTSTRRVNERRADMIALEAAEQSERMDVMVVNEAEKLMDVLKDWDKARPLIVCMERQDVQPVAKALQSISAPAGVLIGPEGGFSEAEMTYLKELPFVVPVSLGNRILRAETALSAVLSCFQAISGDWG